MHSADPQADPGPRAASFFQNIAAAMVMTDNDWRITDVNAAFLTLFRREASDLIGSPVDTIFLPSAATAPSAVAAGRSDGAQRGAARHVMASQEGKTYASFLRGDGTRFAGAILCNGLKDEDGAVIGHGAIVRDVSGAVVEQSDQVRALEARAAEFTMLHALYRRTPAMMHSIDQSGSIIDVSEKWLETLGYAREEVVGKPSISFLSEASRDYAINEVLPKFWREGACHNVPYTMVRKDGRPMEVELSAVVDGVGPQACTLAIMSDVSARNTAMRSLRKRSQDLQNFAHIAAHDLQTPLRHISAFGTLCADELADGSVEEAQKMLASMRNSADRLSNLLDALLIYTQAGRAQAQFARANLGEIIDRVLSEIGEQIEATGAKISVGEMPEITCDMEMMGQVIGVLIDNALTYVGPGIEPDIAITARQCVSETMLRIQDNGIGVDTEFQDRIFLPMRRLHSKDGAYPGNGVGLALCRYLVDAQGGTIGIERSDERGSVFYVTIPHVQDAAQMAGLDEVTQMPTI
ncbi:MAG: PAS domain-containing protein [Pseudomonadota bacterium]